jgi:hypothetical protein
VKQHVIECFPAHFSGLDEDAKVFNDFLLSGEIRDLLRPYVVFKLLLGRGEGRIISVQERIRHGSKLQIKKGTPFGVPYVGWFWID